MTTETLMTCDSCGLQNKSLGNVDELPKGWGDLKIECPSNEGNWRFCDICVTICPECIKTIKKVLHKEAK